MSSYAVTLSDQEMASCLAIAVHRMTHSRASRRNQTLSVGTRTFIEQVKDETIGVAGEMGCAKIMGIYYEPGLDVFHFAPDVGLIDVRTVDSKSKCLIVRNDDPDDRNVVLAVVEGSEVSLVGWIRTEEAKNDAFLRNPKGIRPSWFIPIAKLNNMEDLMAFERNPDEIGVLFEKQSSKGTVYYSGKLNGQDVVGFVKQGKDGKNRIELKKSQPREGQQGKPKPTLYSDESVPAWGDLEKAPF